jgi:hypothetical protein
MESEAMTRMLEDEKTNVLREKMRREAVEEMLESMERKLAMARLISSDSAVEKALL